MEAYRGCAPGCMWCYTKAPGMFHINHSHPYTNKVSTTYVMFARASVTSLTSAHSSQTSAQSPKPFSNAQIDSKDLKGRACFPSFLGGQYPI